MLWFGCCIFLSLFSVAVIVAGDRRQGWFNAVAAGIFGIAFFVSSYLCNLAWMRWVAAGWWGAALLLYAFRHRLEVLYTTTLAIRGFFLVTLLTLFLASGDPFFLVVFGIIALGVIFTGYSYLSERGR